MPTKLRTKISDVLQSTKLFYAAMVLFVFQASWIALSGRFSMPFDENTHLDATRLYSERLLPFWSENPEGVGNLGAVARDPSYLYPYLLSFPYRVIEFFTSNEMTQVILLRFLHIAMFSVGIYLFTVSFYASHHRLLLVMWSYFFSH